MDFIALWNRAQEQHRGEPLFDAAAFHSLDLKYVLLLLKTIIYLHFFIFPASDISVDGNRIRTTNIDTQFVEFLNNFCKDCASTPFTLQCDSSDAIVECGTLNLVLALHRPAQFTSLKGATNNV